MKVFASYSRQDTPAVGPIVAGLERCGHSVWFDTDDIRGGEQWRHAIVRGISGSSTMVLFVSPHSVVSANVQREVTVADEHRLQILPVRLAACEVPPALQYSLAGVQWVDAHAGSTAETVAEIDRILTGGGEPESPTSASRRPHTGSRVRPWMIAAGAGVIIAAVGIGALAGGAGDDASTAAIGETDPAATAPVSAVPTSAAAPAATTAARPVPAPAAPVETGPVVASFHDATGRRALFGGMEYEIESIRLTDGVDISGSPAFDGPADRVGEQLIVRVDVVLRNTTGGPLGFPWDPRIRLAGDPVELTGGLREYDTLFVAEGGSGRANFDFEMPVDGPVDPGLLAGATLSFAAGDAARDGIPLDGVPHEPLAIEPVTVGASVFLAGDAGGTLTVNSIEPALEARGWLGSGADEARDYRVADDEVWLLMNITLDCVGRLPRAGCYFGLEQGAARVESANQVKSMEDAEKSLAEAVVEVVGGGEIGPGGSATVDVMMRVAVSDSYALLLGDPADPNSVERVPLDIAGEVAALHASIAAFQP